ncbi:tyrosine-type recombinase/integrase [[Clostridium] symbiosum]|uniref:tyrosine-type recombinase/integrase n=1 Tax=Clostridium symbiosum TaxID=1512 RepID=UPI001D086AE2|nr:tyrosine-type recombinase/integrase [[Clostridium] symbiosum]MCB6611593.1 tyrosine-type recombinase/integrase [[Clostridium] symbiosum]MCB6931469.1 tyrosine-type recombinase/integrase [[Clostridium] symbiosum]
MNYLSASQTSSNGGFHTFSDEASEQTPGILYSDLSSEEERREYAKQAAVSHALNIEDYRHYLSTQNMSLNTIHVYVYALRQFFALYHDITYSNLKLYKVFLLEHYKPQTVNLRIRAMNSYIEFRNLNPGKIPMVRIQHKNYLDNVISEADYEYLKNCLLRDHKYLYYFIIRFMAATGARVSEVIQFEAEDIFSGYKDIYSKGNKVRRIYVPKALQKDAITWLKTLKQDRGFVFLNRYGTPITPGGIRGQLKNMAIAYGMNPEVVHPHSFRHRFAKSFIEKCGDISLLSDLLGHKNLETTRIYLRRSSSEQYEIINKVVDW